METIDQYFEKRKKLYPQKVKGYFRNLKWWLNAIFITIYLGSPMLRYERGVDAANQAILIDFFKSRAYFFFIEIWPEEVYYLAGILIFAAVILFFVTSLFGRVWCGYACFQTVWTDIFIAVERFFQGDRNQRILLDRKCKNFSQLFKKYLRKFLTHFTWILVSLITGFGFVAYFNDFFVLWHNLVTFNLSPAQLGWILGVAFATYIMAGFAREQVCTYMCPYARFQSAMFDKDTLIISYDEKRGEQRGKHKQGDSFEDRGHCIDCKQCVVVCPQGIDIRDGLQMECIACGLCIDACDQVMTKVGLPKGLIRYDTLNNLENTDKSKNTKFRFWRGRTLFYLVITVSVIFLMVTNLTFKPVMQLNIIPNRNPVFVVLSNGSIRNGYVVKIMNKTHKAKTFAISSLNSNLQLKIEAATGIEQDNLPVESDSVGSFKLYATLPPSFFESHPEVAKKGRVLIDLLVTDKETNHQQKIPAVFISK
jgi:cytochrome c oxidase accessory protein FixG